MEEINKITEDFLENENWFEDKEWIKERANEFIQRFNKALAPINKITPKEKLEIRSLRNMLFNLKSKAEKLGVVVDELKTVDEIGILPMEKIKEIDNILRKISSEKEDGADDYIIINKFIKAVNLIPKFNNALKELDDETTLKNQVYIRQIKYKLKMCRKYAVSPYHGGMREEDVEQLFDKECKVIV